MRYVALLRGINVGGHKVIRMSELAAMFTSLGFTNVRTYIASGNVLFDSVGSTPPSTKQRRESESRIREGVLETFGHEVKVMVRTCDEIIRLAKSLDNHSKPSPPIPGAAKDAPRTDDRVYVLFLAETPSKEALNALEARATPIDSFQMRDLEIIWSCRRSLGASLLTNVVIEKSLGVAATARDLNTVRKLADLCR